MTGEPAPQRGPSFTNAAKPAHAPHIVGTQRTPMELSIIARFHAREGKQEAVAAALREQVGPVRQEPGCIEIGAYASTRDPRLFFIHSRWKDEAAFDVHAELPRTNRFVETMETLIDHPFDAARVSKIG
jgi:quinol monooxygenase YgiN